MRTLYLLQRARRSTGGSGPSCKSIGCQEGEMKLKAHIAVEDGNEFDTLVGQVIESGHNKFQPNNMARKVPKSKEEDIQIDPKVKANMDWLQRLQRMLRVQSRKTCHCY